MISHLRFFHGAINAALLCVLPWTAVAIWLYR